MGLAATAFRHGLLRIWQKRQRNPKYGRAPLERGNRDDSGSCAPCIAQATMSADFLQIFDIWGNGKTEIDRLSFEIMKASEP